MTNMNYQEFMQLVADMRKAQKDYFACRSKSDLQRSKQLEKQVDEAIKQELKPQPLWKTLFENESQGGKA